MIICSFIETYYTDRMKTKRLQTCCIYQKQILVSLYTDINRQVKWHSLYTYSHTLSDHILNIKQFSSIKQYVWLNNRTGPHCRPLVRTSNSTFITKSPRAGVSKLGPGGPAGVLQSLAPTLIKHLKQLIKLLLGILVSSMQVCLS